MDENNGQEEQIEKAQFDFSRLYYLHQQAYGLAYRRTLSKDVTPEDMDKWIEQQLFVVQRSLVSVPSYLLRDDAPKNIDWQAEDAPQWWTFGALDILHTHFVDAYNARQKKLAGR